MAGDWENPVASSCKEEGGSDWENPVTAAFLRFCAPTERYNDMLPNSRYVKFDYPVPPALRSEEAKPFNLSLPIHRAWDTSQFRILLIIERVDTEDLRSRKLMTGPMLHTFLAMDKLGTQYAKHLIKERACVSAINFNYFRTAHLQGADKDMANQEAARRSMSLIRKLKPHLVFIVGATAAQFILNEDPEHVFYNQGRVRTVNGIKFCTTVDISDAYQGKDASGKGDDDDDEGSEQLVARANLIGFMGRCWGNALAKRSVYRIKLQAKAVMIDTIEKWRKFHAYLMKQHQVSVDTETKSLARQTNTILTMQIAFNGEKAYFIPIEHKDAPWSKEELLEIRNGLRQFFARKFDPLADNRKCFLLGQNLKFDISVIRQWLQIHVITWPVWDLMAGFYLLDENMAANRLSRKGRGGKKGAGSYGLLWMTKWLDCDFYTDNAFGKDDRFNIGNLPLTTPGLIDYCVADAQVVWLVREQLLQWAQRKRVNGLSYRETYEKFMLTQMSNMIHIESMMEHRGDHMDEVWLAKLLHRDGPLYKARREKTEEFRKFASVKRVNKKLLKAGGVSTGGDIFGEDIWLFSITKPDHKKQLFLEELDLEPDTYSSKTKEAKLDKGFQAKHAEVPEVQLFAELSQIDKLIGTYAKGFWKKLKTSTDSIYSKCLHASFGFVDTVTGRSNSYDPNLQNLPQHGKFAKLIKRIFASERGKLILKMDYSAHEVRMWGTISGDHVLCNLFVNGRWLRQQFRMSENPVFKDLMDTVGDIHKVNCQFFFEVDPADVTKDQRNSVKSIVFGAIYGRGAKAIAKQAKSTKEAIEVLMKRFFARFKKASAWLEKAKKDAVEKDHVVSPSGRVRNLYAHLTKLDNFIAASERRGANAPVQGFAADLGHTGAYLFEIHLERVCRKFGLDKKRILQAGVCSFVHDAIKTVVPYSYYLVALQVLQWTATIGICEYYKKHFGVKFHVEPEIEIEIAAHDANHIKWGWDETGLKEAIREALEDQKEVYPDLDVDAAEKEVWAIRTDPKHAELVKYLDEHYPILADWPDSIHLSKDKAAKELGPAIAKHTAFVKKQGSEALKYMKGAPGVPEFIAAALKSEPDTAKHEALATKIAKAAIAKARAVVKAETAA